MIVFGGDDENIVEMSRNRSLPRPLKEPIYLHTTGGPSAYLMDAAIAASIVVIFLVVRCGLSLYQKSAGDVRFLAETGGAAGGNKGTFCSTSGSTRASPSSRLRVRYWTEEESAAPVYDFPRINSPDAVEKLKEVAKFFQTGASPVYVRHEKKRSFTINGATVVVMAKKVKTGYAEDVAVKSACVALESGVLEVADCAAKIPGTRHVAMFPVSDKDVAAVSSKSTSPSSMDVKSLTPEDSEKIQKGEAVGSTSVGRGSASVGGSPETVTSKTLTDKKLTIKDESGHGLIEVYVHGTMRVGDRPSSEFENISKHGF